MYIEPLEVLHNFFHYENFRANQKEIIDNILSGNDSLNILPTGAGKSICYQIPAIIFSGITIVISPLISLMKDQVDRLNQINICSTFINSSLPFLEFSKRIENIKNNKYKIIYIAPERLNSKEFIEILKELEISMITIDEAHCVSQWGRDFRPSYKNIAKKISKLNKRPIISAFTATATENVKNDIIKLLKLKKPYISKSSFDRKNLKFVTKTVKNKTDFILEFLNQNGFYSEKYYSKKDLQKNSYKKIQKKFQYQNSNEHICKNIQKLNKKIINNIQKNQGLLIIYCLTRKNVDFLFNILKNKNYLVSKYHGGMTDIEKKLNQEKFMSEKTNIMIATNAFGMGIDKSNIRYVIHYNMPKDLENYYQEAGRAGRDGKDSECILLFDKNDIISNKFLIEHTSSEDKHLNEYIKLNEIIGFCNTNKCLRKYILNYFGEKTNIENCKNCSNCLNFIDSNSKLNNFSNFELISSKITQTNNEKENLESMQINNTEIYYIKENYKYQFYIDKINELELCQDKFNRDYKKCIIYNILLCIKQTHEKFNGDFICDILIGAKNPKIKKYKLYNLSSYGSLSNYSKEYILNNIFLLISEKYIYYSNSGFLNLCLTKLGKKYFC